MKKPNLPNDSHAEKLTDLGQRLQELRLEKGLTVDQVSVRTLIPVRILSAIETGDRSQLPEPVYVQGFLRRYADAVGADGVELAEEFSPGASAHSSRPIRRFNIQAHLRPLHLYLLYTVLVMGAVSSLSYLLHRPSAQVTGLIEPPPKAVPSAAPGTAPVGPPAPPAASQPKPNSTTPQLPARSVQVGVKLTEQSWISIVADGKNEFEGVLPEGSQRTWQADKQLTVRAGNAGGVLISLNNGTAKPLGNPGSVEEITFKVNTQAALPDQENSTIAAAQRAF